MVALKLFVCFFICGALAAPANNEERIIGGTPAKLGEIPYIISLKQDGKHFCGGSILDKNHVLTAANCVVERSPSLLQIQYGVIDSQSKDNIVQVKKIHVHEEYDPENYWINDLAVLTLEDDIVFSENAQPTVLPTGLLIFEGDSIESSLSGWGYTNVSQIQKYLQTVTFDLFNIQLCSILINGYHPVYQICAGDLDGSRKQCSGDAGGPLYANGAQHGIVSWSYKPCNAKFRPGVFTSVGFHVGWIKSAMEDN